MEEITVGVLTISDRCHRREAVDESGPNLIRLIEEKGILKSARVVERGLVPDEKSEIVSKLKEWCDQKRMMVVLTTGGTGVAPRDVTPEATDSLLEKKVPGISSLMLNRSLEVTPLAALCRGLAGVRGQSLIVNLPGSKKASQECLESISGVIRHAVDLIRDVKGNVERVHSTLRQGGEKKIGKSKVKLVTEEERKRKSPYPCLKVSEAQEIILRRAEEFKRKKSIDFEKALGHVLATEAKAVDDLPPFDASIKDGYAVISSDRKTPKTLIGSCAAGNLPEERLISGCCMSINTGAPLPAGADAVVQVEDTHAIQSGCATEIGMTAFPVAGENVRPKGFDFKKGETLIPARTLLGSSSLGLLAAAGVLAVDVFEKPTVSVMSTGDEVVDPRDELAPGRIRDSNRITLISMLKEEGFVASDLGIARDDPDDLFSALAEGFESSDLIVTTGSMSMGDRDFLKEVLAADFGAEIHFGAVFMKPGKPTAFATLDFRGKRKLWFGLPGNPASAVVTTHLFLLPALRKISGNVRNVLPSRVESVLSFDVKLLDRPHYHRGVLSCAGDGFRISSTGNQSSSRVGSCSEANCLVEIPDGNGILRAGTKVTALLIGRHF